ncbi:BrnT family toxin [Cupriavidus necator]|nr:BrnT family toxin [Cupriavidus necator]MDX6010338.1 BrnT family toxin [Cupriavidus necator]
MAYGPIGRRLYCPVFTIRGNTLRVISLRKANSREVRDYEQET